ncbi:hypothetical protein IGI04_013778, partial [Brassica rapa subsp. trilocularis]
MFGVLYFKLASGVKSDLGGADDGLWMMDIWSSGESGVTLLEGGGKRPCCVPFIADLVVGRGYRLVFSDLQGGGAMSYGVGDVQRLPKSGMHPFGSVTNGLFDNWFSRLSSNGGECSDCLSSVSFSVSVSGKVRLVRLRLRGVFVGLLSRSKWTFMITSHPYPKSQVLGRYRLASVGCSDKSCVGVRSGGYRVCGGLCAATVNPDHWH